VLPDGTSVVAAALANDNVPFAPDVVCRGGTDLTQTRQARAGQLLHCRSRQRQGRVGEDGAVQECGPPMAMSEPAAAGDNRLYRWASAGGPVAASSPGPMARGRRRRPPWAAPPLVLAAEAGSAPAMKALGGMLAPRVSIKAADGTTVALAAARQRQSRCD